MSRGNTMMLLYVMIKNEISQVKETNVHIPKGDSIPFLSVCPLSSIAQCLKIAQKVPFNIASEASYVYILSGQKFIKIAKNERSFEVFGQNSNETFW